MKRRPEKLNKQQSENNLRLLPLGLAALVCFLVAVSSGTVFWCFFGSKSPYRRAVAGVTATAVSPKSSNNSEEIASNNETANVLLANNAAPISPASEINQPGSVATETTAVAAPSPVAQPEEQSATSESAAIVLAPAGELPVEGGEVVLGGGSKLPLRREYVNSFAIAETEVTNAQFREFVDAEKTKFKLPVGRDNEPVTGVSWKTAKAYCDWLSQKTGAQVRLPTEAEWELAARGKEGLKYPWGNEWKDENAACKESGGKVKAVKSYPDGKSPCGAFDMVGNVWEWTADPGRDEFGKIIKYKGGDPAYLNETVYVIKGGAAIEAKNNNYAQSRINLPLNFSSPDIGFRYVVVRKKADGERQ